MCLFICVYLNINMYTLKFLLHFKFFLCVGMHTIVYLLEVRSQLVGVCSLFSPCGVLGIKFRLSVKCLYLQRDLNSPVNIYFSVLTPGSSEPFLFRGYGL